MTLRGYSADLCGTEIALITLVDSDRQSFKARVGVEQTGTARDLSFCGRSINGHQPLVVEDTLQDPRFADNPLATGDPWIRFYAGVPLLIDEGGSSVGALSVADRAPRGISDRQMEALRRLARQFLGSCGCVVTSIACKRVRGSQRCRSVEARWFSDRWRIARELGRGAARTVFEAHDSDGARFNYLLCAKERT